MKQLCLYILSFSGLLSVALCKHREFILIKELKTWTDAQTYCKINHVDLATIQTAEDETNVQEVALNSTFTSVAWIGLYDNINSWRWSYQEESIDFLKWLSGQPDNYAAGEACVTLRNDGYWIDRYCTYTYAFLCFDVLNSTVEYYLMKQPKTWSNAQQYCKDRYTDLVTIRNETENELLRNLRYGYGEVWIGLFRDTWTWSDKSNLSSSNQLAAQYLSGGSQNCATRNYYGSFQNWVCSTTFYFYCNTVKLRRQIVRVQLNSTVDNMSDVQLKTLVLQKLQETLSDLMVDSELTLTWRKQLNGKVFQKRIVPSPAYVSNVCYSQFY
ncbi:putative C-type lectin domain family 20 member A [Misgurnus anguillicaudatus]|uniref:putative C-type lectin domain family 20 member A n=1 Tax=Misgurnus anguillicaudatus TaxID=75329 RepID=UPI003CCFC3D6